MTVTDILTSFWYNRETSELIDLCDELLGRINQTYDCEKWTDDGNIVYGAMIRAFGAYGTSTRAGWFTDEVAKKSCTEQIEDFKIEMLGVKEREED